MAQQSTTEVLIIGGGPTGLFIGCLLIDQGVHVTIVEKRIENTRRRPVKLMGKILLSDMIVDEIYVFSENQIEQRQKAIDSMKLELFVKIAGWLEISKPIREIQEELRKYFISSGGNICVGERYDFSQNLGVLDHYPDALVIDCTGYHSLLRNHIQPNNRIDRFIEYVIVWTFLFNDRYECNELCKFYKNRNTRRFQVIPSVNDTFIRGNRMTQVTCLITIDRTIFEQVSAIKPLTFEYLSEHFSEMSDDMNTFLNNLSSGDIKKFPIDKMELVALPLHVYRAKKMVHHRNDNNLNQHWVLIGDAAMGGPYFQSISMGYEAAIYFAYIFKHMKGNVDQMLNKYEDYMEKLWLTIQIRSREIQRNKEILQAICADNRNAILEKIKIY